MFEGFYTILVMACEDLQVKSSMVSEISYYVRYLAGILIEQTIHSFMTYICLITSLS